MGFEGLDLESKVPTYAAVRLANNGVTNYDPYS